MNLLLLHPEDYAANDTVIIVDRRAEHLLHIVKVKVGDRIDAGLLNSKIGEAQIIAIDSPSITLKVELTQPPPPPLALTLVLALPRPLMLKRILQSITAFGVKEIHLISSGGVEKSYWNSHDLEAAVIHQQLLFGLEQARDTILPSVHLHKKFTVFIKNDLPVILAGKRALLAHPGDYPPCPANCHQPLLLAVGPESGFTDHEVTMLAEAGFEIVQMGERALRVETAVSALLGRLLPV